MNLSDHNAIRSCCRKTASFPDNFGNITAEATTEGSSIAIGTTYSFPFIKKFNPKPSGSGKVPTTFSINLSAVSTGNDSVENKSFISSSEKVCIFATNALRSSTVILYKQGILEVFMPTHPLLFISKVFCSNLILNISGHVYLFASNSDYNMLYKKILYLLC